MLRSWFVFQQVLRYRRIHHLGRSIWSRYLLYPGLALLFLALSVQNQASAQIIQQIDPFGAGTRRIPDIKTGGTVPLSSTQIIDIVILGDGYLAGESGDFFNHARDWYNRLFGGGGRPGIRPYIFFPEAFRVRAVFEVSAARACGPDDSERDSYYRVKLSCNSTCKNNPPPTDCSGTCGISGGTWYSANDSVNLDFRNRLFDSVDDVTPLNDRQYPSDLVASPFEMASHHRNIVVAMLIRQPDGQQTGGRVTFVPKPGSTRIVGTALGRGWEHEFSHAFAYLKDEYIDQRGVAASSTNPVPADRSVYNLDNRTFTNDRCDLLWPHLAPGGIYNPNPLSVVGNLFKGGVQENNVWHSEYLCLMNGGHENYYCNVGDSAPDDVVYIRDHTHFCFWCEEIAAIRILEKTGQLGSEAVSNAMGRTWSKRWLSSLRHQYYIHFDIPNLIAERDACYDHLTGRPCPPEFPNCEEACDDPYSNPDLPTMAPHRPSCLRSCTIREVGNGMYVDSGAGTGGNGSWEEPYDDIPTAVDASHGEPLCNDPHLIIVKPGSYPGSLTLDTRATLVADGCNLVSIGD